MPGNISRIKALAIERKEAAQNAKRKKLSSSSSSPTKHQIATAKVVGRNTQYSIQPQQQRNGPSAARITQMRLGSPTSSSYNNANHPVDGSSDSNVAQGNSMLPPSAYAIPMKLNGMVPFAALAFGQSLPDDYDSKKSKKRPAETICSSNFREDERQQRKLQHQQSPSGRRVEMTTSPSPQRPSASSLVKSKMGSKAVTSSIFGKGSTDTGMGGTELERQWRRRIGAVRDTFDGVRAIILRDHQQQRLMRKRADRHDVTDGHPSLFRDYATTSIKDREHHGTSGPTIRQTTTVPTLGSPEFSRSLFDSVTRDLSSVIDHVMDARLAFTDPVQAEKLLHGGDNYDGDDDETLVEDAGALSLLTCTEKLDIIPTGVKFPDDMIHDGSKRKGVAQEEEADSSDYDDEEEALLECKERLPPLADEDSMNEISMMKRLQEEFYSSSSTDSSDVDDEDAMLLLQCHEKLDDEELPGVLPRNKTGGETQTDPRGRAIQMSQELAMVQELTRIIRQKTLELARQRISS